MFKATMPFQRFKDIINDIRFDHGQLGINKENKIDWHQYDVYRISGKPIHV